MSLDRLRLFATVAVVSLAVILPLATSVADPSPAPGKKVALLVGINDYDNRKLEALKYAERDISELAAILKDAGFSVRVLLGSSTGEDQATRKNIESAFDKLLEGVTKRDTVLLAFSGHGQQLYVEEKGPDDKAVKKEVPFFCPKDAVPYGENAEKTLFSLSKALKTLDQKGGGSNLLLIDACRNVVDPNKGARGGIDGSRVEVEKGTAVFFACSPRQRAYETAKMDKDGKNGHGVFFHFVLEGLRGAKGATNERGEVTWERLVPYVKEQVESKFSSWFPDVAESEQQEPHSIGSLGKTQVLITYRETIVSKSSGMQFVRIPVGKKFLMGSPKDEKERLNDEDQHEVEIKRPFALGITAVTRGQFRKFVEDDGYKTEAEKNGKGGFGWDEDSNDLKQNPKYTWREPGFVQTDEHPVVNVSWNDAQAFCAWLSKKDGRRYRLPTEAEWEYACRAGSTTRYSFGDDDEDLLKHANVADASFRQATKKDDGIRGDDGFAFTAPARKFKANGFGVFDMHGNVWQWCEDYYGPYEGLEKTDPWRKDKYDNKDLRVLRGGSWYYGGWYCRSAFRCRNDPANCSGINGFRVCLPLD